MKIQTHKCIAGIEYFGFFLDTSNKGTSFRVDTGIVKVTPTNEVKQSISFGSDYIVFKVLELYKKPRLAGRELEKLLNYDSCYCISHYYDNYEEACNAYDEKVISVMKNAKCNANELKALNNMLINKKTELQIAKLWYKSLDNLHKSYLKTLGFTYNHDN